MMFGVDLRILSRLKKGSLKYQFVDIIRPTIQSSMGLMNNDSHTFRISLVAGVEEIMCDVHVCNVRLKQLEPEPTGGENGGEGEVELTVCETI